MNFCNTCGHVFTEAETDVFQLFDDSELLEICPKCGSLDIEEIIEKTEQGFRVD